MEEKYRAFAEAIMAEHEKGRPINLAKPLQGKRILIPREKGEPVEAILYREAEGDLPVFFNMHGGGWISGDATLMDSFCYFLAKSLPICVINLNYRKAPEHPFPYAVEEAYGAMDYVAKHPAEYGIDPDRMAVGGHSAGANLAAAASLMAADLGGPALKLQLLVYPCTDLDTPHSVRNPDCTEEDLEGMRQFIALYFGEHPENTANAYASPLLAEPERLQKLCPAAFVTCGLDVLRAEGEEYAKKLIDCGVEVAVRRYADALHGFVEVNRPDYPDGDPRKNPEQAALCRDAEQWIREKLELALCR